jgi:YgiT-type zinc finger domain-containing protein
MEQRQGALSYHVHREDIEVPDVQHRGCSQCGEVVLSLEQANTRLMRQITGAVLIRAAR